MHDFVWRAVSILTDFFKSKRFQHIQSNLICVNEELCTMPKFLFFVVSLLVGKFFVNMLDLKWREGKNWTRCLVDLEATRAKGKRIFNFLKFTLFKKSNEEKERDGRDARLTGKHALFLQSGLSVKCWFAHSYTYTYSSFVHLGTAAPSATYQYENMYFYASVHLHL